MTQTITTSPTYDLAAICRLLAPAPALEGPRGHIVRVRDTAGLYAAVAGAGDDTTILLEDGVYRCQDLRIRQGGLAIRSASGDRDKVILDADDQLVRMIVLRGAKDFLLADLTMRNCRHYGLLILGDSDVQRPRVHNVRFQNIWTRAVKGTHAYRVDDTMAQLLDDETVERIRPRGGSIRHCLFYCDRVKPYADEFNGDYVSGIDMMHLDGWAIADNAFVGIRGRNGRGRGGIFVWVDSRNVVAERNVFVGCDRAICFGNPSGDPLHMTGGIARNNLVVGGAFRAVEMVRTRDTLVAHNTVWTPRRQHEAIVFEQGAAGGRCVNNLVHGAVALAGEVRQQGNLVGDLDGWFHRPEAGDLRLTPAAASAVGAGLRAAEVTDDFHGRPRPEATTIGACEGCSPLDIPGVKTRAKTRDILSAVREVRRRER